jgi:hypothetical protein
MDKGKNDLALGGLKCFFFVNKKNPKILFYFISSSL